MSPREQEPHDPSDVTDSDPSLKGWYADPSGRHRYRYWNGTAWTERVATDGQEAADPPVGKRPAGKRASSGSPAPTSASEAARPRRKPTNPSPHRKRRWAAAVALIVLLGAVVATSIFVLGPKRKRTERADATSTTRHATTATVPSGLAGAVPAPGAGDFSTTLDAGKVLVHTIHLVAGQTAVIGWQVTSGQATVRLGIAAKTVDRLADHQFVTDAQRTSALHDAESLLTVLPPGQAGFDTLSVRNPNITLAGFTGVVLGPPGTLVAPVEGDYAVIIVATADRTVVDTAIAVRDEPTVTADLQADTYNQLIAGPFRDAVNRFVTAFCMANPARDRGACDRLQNDNDGWAGTGADPAPIPVPVPGSSGSTDSGGTTTTRPGPRTTTTSRGFGVPFS